MILKLILVAGIVLVTSAVIVKQKDMTYRQSILKKVYPLIMQLSSKKGKEHIQLNSNNIIPNQSLYSIELISIDGKVFDLNTLKGKKILIVNTASDCGFTGQYASLEKLYQQYQDKLVIIGVPANDFKEQESSSNENINAFCKRNYGVSFPLMSKSVVVKTKEQHPLYQWLSDASKNGWCTKAPEWNFCKYLIDEQGKLIGYFPMTVDPMSEDIISKIN